MEDLFKDLPHTALGMFKDGSVYKLMVIRFNNQLDTKVEDVAVLSDDKNIARDQFKVKVIEKGMFK